MPAVDPLDIVTNRIRARANDKDHPEDWLTATFHTVEMMDDRQLNFIMSELVGRPLSVHDADLAQLVAQKLGKEILWQNCQLVGTGQWQEGRGKNTSNHAKGAGKW